jgi:peptidoglycan hydrolase-like protein with peptidoglycan-binding domain
MAVKISSSVGKGGKNKPEDVKQVQELLNQHRSAGGYATLKVDGQMGKKTLAAIEAFQKKVLAGSVDGRINPGRETLAGLTCKPGKVATAAAPSAASNGKADGKSDDDDDADDMFDPEVLRRRARKLCRAPFRFALALAGKAEDCKLVLQRKGNPKVLGQALKKQTNLPKVTWGMASAAEEDEQVLVLEIQGKQLPGMAKKGKKLLKLHKLMPFRQIRLIVDGAEVEDLPDDDEAQAGADDRMDARRDDADKAVEKARSTVAQAPQAWRMARRTVAARLDQLKKAVRKDFADEGPEMAGEIDGCLTTLDGVLARLDDRLATSMEKAAAATDDRAREAELKKSLKILAQYSAYVMADPVIDHIDANPFGINTNLQDGLSQMLEQMGDAVAAIGAAA